MLNSKITNHTVIKRWRRAGMLLLAAAFLPQLLVSCSKDGEEPSPVETITYDRTFVNFTIVVGAGNEARTRAPEGGEEGDGRESGFAHENKVTGITVLLYQGDINAAGTTKIDHAIYYPVMKTDTWPAPNTDQGTHADEAYYTTGNRRLRDLGADITKSYHVIVVANLDITPRITPGTTTLDDVRDYIDIPQLYYGSAKGGDAEHFIMSSENDATLNFPGTTPTDIAEGKLYTFTNIRVERLAARIDFWTENGTYATDDGLSTPHDFVTPGYRYAIDGSSDVFVLTKVTPFNLYNGTEYLIKRTSATTNPYLADEAADTWVIDPNRKQKDNTNALGNYDSKLADVITNGGSDFTMKASDMHASSFNFNIGSSENVVIAYTGENTLLPESHLYKYATGLCLQGDIYKNGDASNKEPVTVTVYGYLRHQQEGTGEPYLITETPLDGIAAGDKVMNFGTVRNNIYRVSIDKIKDKGAIILKLKVKKWDEFLHKEIYI